MTRAAPTTVVLAALLAVLAWSAPAAAQGSGRLFFTGGLHRMELDELNQRLRARGLPAFSDDLVALGVGLDSRSGSWLLGGEALLFLAEEESGGGLDRSLDGRFGVVEAGYAVPLAAGFRVYPMLGAGWSDLKLAVSQGDAVPFDDVLEGASTGAEVSTGGLIFQPGLGADLVTGGFTVGIRGGWIFSPGTAEWSSDDVAVEDGPDIGLEGPFLRATLGFADN